MSVKNQIIKGTIVLTTATLLSRILGFLYRIFLSNLIGAKGMGIFQLIFPVLGFCVALSCGGIQIAVSRFVAESKSNERKFMTLISSIIMSLFLSSFTAVCLFLFALPVSEHIIKNAECAQLLKYACITIPMASFHACISGYYLGIKKTFVPAFSSILEQVVKVGAIYILGMVWIAGKIEITPLIAVYSMIISESAGVCFCLIAICSEKKYSFKIRELFSSMKGLFSVSYILTVNKIMITFLQCVEAILVPIVLIKSGLSNHDALSIYGVLTGMALPVVSFPSAINTSVSTMILPAIAQANTSNEPTRVKRTTEVSIWFSMVTGIFCIGIFLFYGDFIGTTIFGHPEAGEYIKILAWLCPFMYLSITMGSILHGLGKTNTAFLHNVIGTAIRLFCLWFLVPVTGITGYLWGLLASNLVITLLHGVYIYRQIPFHFSPVESIIKPTAWLLCSLAVGKLMKYIFQFASFSGKAFHITCAAISAGCVGIIFLYFFLRQFRQMKQTG